MTLEQQYLHSIVSKLKFKNTIYADRAYVRDDPQIQGWILVNFIALILLYRTYCLLRSKNLL
ncbi:MAG: hypothetical protein QXQ46_10275 [Thermoplasmatales archaeon]